MAYQRLENVLIALQLLDLKENKQTETSLSHSFIHTHA